MWKWMNEPKNPQNLNHRKRWNTFLQLRAWQARWCHVENHNVNSPRTEEVRVRDVLHEGADWQESRVLKMSAHGLIQPHLLLAIVTSVPGDLIPFFGFQGHCINVTHRHAHWQNTCAWEIINLFLNARFPAPHRNKWVLKVKSEA